LITGMPGSGKTTLLRLLLGELEPQSGEIRLGTRREVLYFDQLREQLDPDQTVQENVGEGNDSVLINGRQRHIIGYLQDFLFSPERARSPVRILSGGERNRLLLAKLFTKPSNVLVMDEPSAGLDPKARRQLIELLSTFRHTKIIATHDLDMVMDLCERTIVMHAGEIKADGRTRDIFADDQLLKECCLEKPLRMQGCPVCQRSSSLKKDTSIEDQSLKLHQNI